MVVLCFATRAIGNQPGFDKIAAARNNKRSDPTGTRQNFNFQFLCNTCFVQKTLHETCYYRRIRRNSTEKVQLNRCCF